MQQIEIDVKYLNFSKGTNDSVDMSTKLKVIISTLDELNSKLNRNLSITKNIESEYDVEPDSDPEYDYIN